MRVNLITLGFWMVFVASVQLSCGQSGQKSTNDLVYIKQHIGSKEEKGAVLILLHGYGSNEHDLLGLSALLPSSGDVVSFRAPITLDENAYCWFPRTGHSSDAKVDTTIYQSAAEVLWQSIQHLVEQEGWEGRKLFLAGFSQGAMMCYEMARDHSEKFAGIIGFSGSAKALKHMGVKGKCGADILMTHGTSDQVLTYDSALEAKTRLEGCGASVTFFSFDGGHQITKDVQQEAKTWLEKRL